MPKEEDAEDDNVKTWTDLLFQISNDPEIIRVDNKKQRISCRNSTKFDVKFQNAPFKKEKFKPEKQLVKSSIYGVLIDCSKETLEKDINTLSQGINMAKSQITSGKISVTQ
jgi:hypothetical protein